jgi:hypothetical protein
VDYCSDQGQYEIRGMQIPLSEILERGISHRPRPSEH